VPDDEWVSAEDRDLHSDLIAAYGLIGRLYAMLEDSAEVISQLLDRRRAERRIERGGLAAAEGLDRRHGPERRGE
jgi:hypothetical protein